MKLNKDVASLPFGVKLQQVQFTPLRPDIDHNFIIRTVYISDFVETYTVTKKYFNRTFINTSFY